MREARAAHDAGAYARCSEILAGLAELAPPPDMQADASRLRADAEAALEALPRARDVARATLQRAEDAQRIAEAADAPRQALSLWDAAERKLAEGRAALGAERYAHGEAELEHAQQLFEQAEASARAASAAAAARRANELAAEAARAAAAERLQASERGARAEATRAADHQTQLNVAIRDVGAVMAAETSDILVADPEATMIETPTTAEVAVPVAVRTPVVAAASEVAAPLVESAMAGAAQTIAMPAAAKTIASYRRLPPSALTLRASYRRLRPNVPALRYLALVAVAGIALALVVWRVETVRASKHTKETLDHLRRTVTAAREQALKAEAGRLALDVLAAGQAKASEGDRFTASQNMTAAGQAYEEAAERYREAERLAQTKQQQRNEADTTRARMVTAKQRAQPGAEDFAGALVHERQATSQYERLAFMEAATSFQAAAELFSKALPKPQPVVQDPRADIRTVLNDYVRAVETKNLDLLRRVRTCFTDDDLQHVRAANDIIRSHKVELRVYELTVAGEEAQALGRREDFVLLTNGQQLRTETRFTYTFKHGPRGWALCELRESDPRPARPQAPGDPTPRHAESAPRSAKP